MVVPHPGGDGGGGVLPGGVDGDAELVGAALGGYGPTDFEQVWRTGNPADLGELG